MADSETPVNPSNESSQSLDSEERKKEKKTEEPNKVPKATKLVWIEQKSDEGHNNYARFPVLDEDLIGERGRAVRRYGGGGRRIRIDLIQSNVRQVPNYDIPASLTDRPNQMVPQLGTREDEGEASHNRWIDNVWKSIKNGVVKPLIAFKSLMYLCHYCRVSRMKVKLDTADRDLIAERGRKLAAKQSDINDVVQTQRGFPS